MKKKILLASSICSLLLADATVVPNDTQYYKTEVYNTVLIYPKEYIHIAQDVANLEMLLQPAYEKTFGYKLDETLYTGILSDNNQITNGFTTIYPVVREMNYIGGSLIPDYFCTTSWIDTLIYHETSHAYQLDAKDNQVSQVMHSVIKNGTLFLPWFVAPNIFESSFLMEGNSVLNESWHGNGGRLYGGNFKAETLLQAKYNLLTPELIYNDNLNFLYGSHFYTLGSYFEYFLMQKYGLDKVNNYWKVRSNEFFWPFLTNYASNEAYGKDFETLVKEWNKSLKEDATNIKEAEGNEIASSQFFQPLNANNNEIYLLVNKSAREYPDLIVYDKKQKNFNETTTSHIAGKVLKLKDDNYVTQASSYTNPWRIYIGLYDKNGVIVDGTKSKVIEGYTADAKAVYFDVKSSYHNPQLYVGDSFYGSVNSSVYTDGNDIYYAKQDGKKRTYYKNKTPIFSLMGYYGHIIDVKNGSIYFIANTKLGSGLYRYKDGEFYLMHPSDTIMDAKLIDENNALAVSIGHDRYKIMEVALKEQKQTPYEVKLDFEDKPYYKEASREKADEINLAPKITSNDAYHSLLELQYSGTSISFGSDTDAGFIYMVNLNLSDPLAQNSIDIFAQRNSDEFGFAGATYANTQYFLNYSVTGYGIYERPDETSDLYSSDDERTYGIMADALIDFFRYGYNYGTIMASYYEDYVSNSRKPLSTSITLGNAKYFGYSMDNNFLLEGSGYYTVDRGDNIAGGLADLTQGLPHEFFIKASTQYSSSNAQTSMDDRGVKIASTLIERFKERDISSFYMPSLVDSAYYTKDALSYGVELKKVFNLDAYFFTFPLSFRRESLSIGYEHYDFTDFKDDTFTSNEIRANLTLDTLMLNVMPIPFTFEYIYNDDGDDKIMNKNTFIFRMGIDF
jgi:hypothetical protein